TGGEKAAISGYSAADVIDVTSAVMSAVTGSSFTTSGGNEILTISGTSAGSAVTDTLTFSGTTTYTGATVQLASDGNGGVEVLYNTTVTSGVDTDGLTLSTGSGYYLEGPTLGATASAWTIQSGALLTIGLSATDSATTIS